MVEIGFFSIVLALILSAYCGVANILGLRTRGREMIASSENGLKAIFLCLTVASSIMIYALVTRNFQVQYVAQYTDRTLPLIFTMTAASERGTRG